MEALDPIPIIDVDTHFTEPPDLWLERAPAKLRDRAPRVIRKENGRDTWIVEDGLELGPMGYCVIRSDARKVYGTLCLDTFDELHLGASRAEERLQVMDEHGLTMQLLYPNILGFTGNRIMEIKDEQLRNFCVTAYNDACGELQVAGRGRLFPQCLLPFWDIDLTVRELERCHDALKLTGFTLSSAPESYGLPALNDPYWDPLWARAQERGLPVNFHIGGGGPPPQIWPGMQGPTWVVAASAQTFMANISCVTNLICSGLLDRYPTLKFVSVESGIGWLPFLIEALEYQFDENAVTGLELRPREYFQRQIFASFWFETDARGPIEKLGEDNIMFETDFPHPTCLYPSIQDHVKATLGELEPAVQRKVLCETAARVYQLPLPS